MNKLIIFLIIFSYATAFAVDFKKVIQSDTLSLPKDHGSHREYQTEWWYFTGHLVSEDKTLFKDQSDYGFQLTFFRRASKKKQSKSDWEETYLAHSALTNINENSYSNEERISSGGLGIAGAGAEDLEVWNKNWKAERVGENVYLTFSVKNKCKLRLVSKRASQAVYHGENGVSKKAECEGCASMYYSLAPIFLDGHIECDNKRKKVTGVSWMDHEYMTNALGKEQIGWDWLSLMFEDKSVLMLFQIRNKSGETDFASGTYLKNGVYTKLKKNDFQIIPSQYWQSKKANYPVAWNIKIEKINMNLNVKALVENQEFNSEKGPVYWEGAVKTDQGLGYFEMTGYDKAIEFKP